MSKAAAARRNRALRKIRACEQIDPEIKLAIEVILDLLSPKSGYRVAWPSAAMIAKRLGRSRRTGLWYVRIIKALGIFYWRQFTPSELKAYCQDKYGFKPKLASSIRQAPNLFIVNERHPLWNDDMNVPEETALEMAESIRRIKSERNAKTTSVLASNPAERPTKYSARIVRERLHAYLNNVANDTIQSLLDDVANDTINDVANDTQVFNGFSVAEESPTETHVQIAQGADPSGDLITTRLALSKPASAKRLPTTPPTHHSARGDASQNQSGEPDTVTGTRKRVQGGLTATPIRDRNLLSREGGINSVHRKESLNQLLASASGRRLAGSKPVEFNEFGPRDDAIIETMQRLNEEKEQKHSELNARYAHRV